MVFAQFPPSLSSKPSACPSAHPPASKPQSLQASMFPSLQASQRPRRDARSETINHRHSKTITPRDCTSKTMQGANGFLRVLTPRKLQVPNKITSSLSPTSLHLNAQGAWDHPDTPSQEFEPASSSSESLARTQSSGSSSP